MTPAELAAYRAMARFRITPAERAAFAAEVVAMLADVPADLLPRGTEYPEAWGVTNELARRGLHVTVQGIGFSDGFDAAHLPAFTAALEAYFREELPPARSGRADPGG